MSEQLRIINKTGLPLATLVRHVEAILIDGRLGGYYAEETRFHDGTVIHTRKGKESDTFTLTHEQPEEQPKVSKVDGHTLIDDSYISPEHQAILLVLSERLASVANGTAENNFLELETARHYIQQILDEMMPDTEVKSK